MISSSPLLLILYLCGCAGIILSLGDLIGMPFTIGLLLFGFVTILNLIFWFCYMRFNKRFIYVTLGIILLFSLLLSPQIYSLTGRIKYMVTHGYSLSLLQLNTGFVLIVVFLLTFLLFCLEFILRSHALLLLCGLALMLLTPVFGHSMNLFTMLLLGVFEFGFIVVNMSEKRSLRNVMNMPKRAHINLLCVLLILAVIGISFLPALLIERSAETDLFSWANNTDSFIKNTISALTGNSSDGSVNSGNINRGNLYQSGRNQLMVSVSSRPSSNLYLKGYTGRNYDDSNWDNAFNYEQTMLNSSWDNTESIIGDVFFQAYNEPSGAIPYSFYYLLYDTNDPISEIYYMIAKDTELNNEYFETVEIDGVRYLQVNADQQSAGYIHNPNSTHIYINNLSYRNGRTFYRPYYSQKSEVRIMSETMRYNGYSNSYLSEEDINAADQWDDNPIFQQIVNLYNAQIMQEYTSYPSDTFRRLEELCRAEPLTELNDVTTFILVTLQNQCTYSTTPGNTPYNKDVIDYFLFDNHQGYCVHFASAATLMYRMYGIPARYVTGFVASPADFSANEQYQGYYTATLTDKSAHAWVEIFLKDYGWVPVEVTPNSDGDMRAVYPGYNETIMYTTMAKHNWSFRNTNDSSTNADNNIDNANAQGSGLVTYIIFMCGVPLAFIGLIVFFVIRRRRIISSLPTKPYTFLFDRMMRTLHYSKLLRSYTGSEEDFPAALSKAVPELSLDDTNRIISVMLRNNYSAAAPSSEDHDFLVQACRTLSLSLYHRTPFYKKLLYKYVHAYC